MLRRRIAPLPLPSPPVSVLHVSRSDPGVPGGVDSSVRHLVEALGQRGVDARWYASASHLPWLGDRRLADRLRALRPDVLHVHGLWQFPTRLAALMEVDVPVVIAPHGMLDPWAMGHSRLKKLPVWHLWERRTLAHAACLQALSQAEAEAIHALGLAGPVAVIPNAATVPDLLAYPPPHRWDCRVKQGERVLLFLGRFHPKKGLAPLLEAWRRLGSDPARFGWWLVLAGEGTLPVSPCPERVLQIGPVESAMKQAVLASASGFVLPSFSEGMPMAALEAMSWRLPCLLSPACHLPEAFAAGAALPVEPSVAALEKGLAGFLRLSPAELEVMGAAGHELVADHFSWCRVAALTGQLYGWLLDGGEVPPFVTL